jgi:hypothetical protein
MYQPTRCIIFHRTPAVSSLPQVAEDNAAAAALSGAVAGMESCLRVSPGVGGGVRRSLVHGSLQLMTYNSERTAKLSGAVPLQPTMTLNPRRCTPRLWSRASGLKEGGRASGRR